MPEPQQLLVAGWAQQLSQMGPNERQKRLLRREAVRLQEVRRPYLAADEAIDAPLSRELWRNLSADEKRVVRDPKETGSTYPLSVGDMSKITGLSRRQIQAWSNAGWLPHWRNQRGSRMFGPAALIMSFRMSHKNRNEIQNLVEIFSATGDTDARKEAVQEQIVLLARLYSLSETDRSSSSFESEDLGMELLREIVENVKIRSVG